MKTMEIPVAALNKLATHRAQIINLKTGEVRTLGRVSDGEVTTRIAAKIEVRKRAARIYAHALPPFKAQVPAKRLAADWKLLLEPF